MEYSGCGSARFSLYSRPGCQTLSNAWLMSNVAMQNRSESPRGFCALFCALVLWFHVEAEIQTDDRI